MVSCLKEVSVAVALTEVAKVLEKALTKHFKGVGDCLPGADAILQALAASSSAVKQAELDKQNAGVQASAVQKQLLSKEKELLQVTGSIEYHRKRGEELRTRSAQIGTEIEQLRVRYRELSAKVAPSHEDPGAAVDIAKFKGTFSAMGAFLGRAAEAVQKESLDDLKAKMEAMRSALQSGKEHLNKSVEAVKARGSSARSASAPVAKPHIRSDDGLYNLLCGPSASAEEKKRRLEMVEAVASRCVAGVVQRLGQPKDLVASIYLYDCEQMSDDNVAILSDAMPFLGHSGLPFVMGGEFNMVPEVFLDNGIPELLRGSLVSAPGDRGSLTGPNGTKHYDYFLVSGGLSKCVKEVSLVEEAATYPHLPVCLEFHKSLSTLRALRFRKPPKIPVEPAMGPVVQPPDWSQALELLDFTLESAVSGRLQGAFAGLDSAYEVWANLSEVELVASTQSTIPVFGARGRRPRCEWHDPLTIDTKAAPPSAQQSVNFFVAQLRALIGHLGAGDPVEHP
ncbi:unnamed protein product, partial [Prorocentrum cordatum]